MKAWLDPDSATTAGPVRLRHWLLALALLFLVQRIVPGLTFLF